MHPRSLLPLVLLALSTLPVHGQNFDADPSLGFATVDAISGLSGELQDLIRTVTFQGERPPARRDRWALFSNPDDVDQLGNQHNIGSRVPVVVLHGYSHLYVKHMRLAGQMTWRSLRYQVRRSRRNVLPGSPPRDDLKFVFYYYQPTKPYPELARDLADRLSEGFALGKGGPEKILFLAHSAGAVLARYASMDPRLSGRVGGIVTIAGANRGSIQASLATAHSLAQHPGITEQQLQFVAKVRAAAGVDPRVFSDDPAARIECHEDPVCAVVSSISYDNYDETITPAEQEAHGLMSNDTLRQFNQIAPLADRMIAYSSDTTDFGIETYRVRQRTPRRRGFTHSRLEVRPTRHEIQRSTLEVLSPAWANADPVIHFASSSFADSPRPLLARRSFRNLGHTEMTRDPEVLKSVLEDLGMLARMPLRPTLPDGDLAPDDVGFGDLAMR